MLVSASQDVVFSSVLGVVITGHFNHDLLMWDERSGEKTSNLKLSGRITGLDTSKGTFVMFKSTMVFESLVIL